MKPLVRIALLAALFLSYNLQAQINFAPAGSEWYHAMPYGVFHSAYVADTTILGVNCRKVTQKAYTANPWLAMGLKVNAHPDLFIYSNADTVFVYNHLFSKFTPLYVLNVNAGDTITLPVLPPEPATMTTVTDSFFSFVVDSVNIATYDTAHLKTVYTTPIDPGSPHYYYSYGRDAAHRYAMKIGTVNGGLLPYCGRCIIVTSDAVQYQDSVRCYNDPATAIKLASGICGKDYSAVPQIFTGNDINIFPVPATDYINVSFSKPVPALIATLFNTTGVVVFTGNYINTETVQISTQYLSAGVYYLKFGAEGMPPVTQRVIILK